MATTVTKQQLINAFLQADTMADLVALMFKPYRLHPCKQIRERNIDPNNYSFSHEKHEAIADILYEQVYHYCHSNGQVWHTFPSLQEKAVMLV